MSKIKGILKPIAEEVGKFTKTAGEQVTGTSSDKDKKATEEVVKHLYGVNEKTATTESTASNAAAQREQDKKEIEKKRAQLRAHQEYFQSLTTPKPKEERPAEKVEREKKQEMVDLQKKEKKKPPILVQRAQQSVEKFRGTAG